MVIGGLKRWINSGPQCSVYTVSNAYGVSLNTSETTSHWLVAKLLIHRVRFESSDRSTPLASTMKQIPEDLAEIKLTRWPNFFAPIIGYQCFALKLHVKRTTRLEVKVPHFTNQKNSTDHSPC